MITPTTSSVRALCGIALLTVAIPALSACVPNDASEAEAVAVSSTNDACTLSSAQAAAGAVTFAVTNDGDDVTEFYVFASDGATVVSELEDIGPGVTRELVVTLEAGDYVTACKPGMVGDGIQSAFVVTP